jgi:CHAT domain-containing protein/tetratricopeptide (TPR) repeat protein
MSEHPDEHASSINALRRAGDWAGLVRYWLSQGLHQPALDAAIALLRKQRGRKNAARLVKLLTAVRTSPLNPPDELLATLFRETKGAEQATLLMIAFFPRATLCEMADAVPSEQREEALRKGIEAADQIVSLGHSLGDLLIQARFRIVQANGYRSAHQFDQAEASYAEALGLYRELWAAHPDSESAKATVATTLNNLGNAQTNLGRPEAAEKSCTEALRLRRELLAAHPDSEAAKAAVGRTLNNLGNAQSDLGRPEAAEKSYTEALRHCRDLLAAHPDSESAKADVATTLHNLSTAQRALGRPEAAEKSLTEALGRYRDLLAAHPNSESAKADVAMTLNNLGNAQSDLGRPEAAEKSYTEALRHCRELLAAHPDSESAKAAVATTLNNLGTAQSNLGRPEAAEKSYTEALKLYETEARDRPNVLVPDRLQTHVNLGTLVLRDWEPRGWPDPRRALDAFREAVRLAEIYRGSFRDPRNREHAQRETQHAYERLVETCIDLFHIDDDPSFLVEAITTAEKSRARRLFELLNEEDLVVANASEDLVRRFRNVRDALQAAVYQESRPEDLDGRSPGPEPVSDGRSRSVPQLSTPPLLDAEAQRRRWDALQHRVNRLQAEYDGLKAELQACDPEFDPDRPVPAVPFDRLCALVPTDVPTAVVHYTISDQRGQALILHGGKLDAVRLPELDAGQAAELAWRWMKTYRASSFKEWSERLPELLEPVAERAVRPVIERLAGTGIRRLILVPNRYLYPFPLHACRLPDGAYLADAFDEAKGLEIAYAPSLSILDRCLTRDRPATLTLAAAENPTGDLDYAPVEVARVQCHYAHPEVEHGNKVNLEWIAEKLRTSRVWHYAGHSQFNPNDPLDSALILDNKDVQYRERWLTLRSLFTRRVRLPQNRLSVLSGCESGMLQVERIDEYVGLPAGFLFAGAQCVVASLWRVNDLSTALLMDQMYERWHAGQTIGAALHQAQRWLRRVTGRDIRHYVRGPSFRASVPAYLHLGCAQDADDLEQSHPDTPPFDQPAHWAAFIATGLTVLRGHDPGTSEPARSSAEPGVRPSPQPLE